MLEIMNCWLLDISVRLTLALLGWLRFLSFYITITSCTSCSACPSALLRICGNHKSWEIASAARVKNQRTLG